MSDSFVHLHNHSYYSLLDGLSSPEALVKQAKDLGYTALALTDHGSCAGLYSFQNACKKEGIKPILGMEGYITPDRTKKEKGTPLNHIVLLAKNKVGYHNLIRLSSLAYIEGFYYKARLDFSLLEKYKEGLIVTSACSAGEVSEVILQDKEKATQIANKYREVFGENYYLEIMLHDYTSDKERGELEKKIARAMVGLSKETGIKAICTQDTHYAKPEEWFAHDVLLSIQTLDVIKNPERLSFRSKDFYLKSAKEISNLYKQVPILMRNTLEINEKIEPNLILSHPDLLPDFIPPVGFKTSEDYLKALVTDGMKQKGLIDKPEYRERIRYEMNTILKCGYVKYFLVLWDIINFARVNNIRTGIGRGSGASSLCLYVLGITKADPLKYDLIFERFLNPERVSPPDVDIDFDYYRRKEVYEYVVRKYKPEYCCQIGTYNAFKARATVRSTVKALDLGNDWEAFLKKKEANPSLKAPDTNSSLDIADRISKLIPFKAENIAQALKEVREFEMAMRRYPQLLECVKHIEGTVSSAGVHPAGIIVCKDPVIEHVPLRVKDGVIASQYDMSEVEKIGLLKYDLLAIKTLTVIDKTVKMVNAKEIKIKDIDALEPNDPNVFKVLSGQHPTINNKGVFQFEADGISGLLKNIRVDSFEDMIVANALYRPGPLGSGMHDMYCNYKHGRAKIQYLHPKMGEVLKDTYGIIIFQEQISKVAQVLAGFTMPQADMLRYAVGKKKKDKLAEQQIKFVEGCAKNGIDSIIATKIFEQINYFGDYGFNRSHSCVYALTAYQTAWLKYYYPLEFMCNLLTSEIDNNDKNKKLEQYIWAAKRMGLNLLPADINKSGLEFQVEPSLDGISFIRKPLTMMKGVGSKAVESIVHGQPYKNLRDFIQRTDARVVNRKVFATLLENGCMDSWHTGRNTRNTLFEEYTKIREELEAIKKEKDKMQKKLNKLGKVAKDFGSEFGFVQV